MKRLIPAIFVISIAAWSAAVAQPPVLVRVAAASDLKFAIDDAVRQFTAANPAIRVEPTYGSSGTFHAQLRQRAPYDIFLSADVEYPRDLVARGLGAESDLFVYAIGHLVVWVPSRSTLALDREGLGALRRAKRVAIGNPRHAPYGRAAEAALRRASLWQPLQERLVLGESVAQTAQFVQSGAADAGLIAKSFAVAPAMRAAGRFWEVPPDGYPEMRQGGLILPWAASRESALKLRDFLLGPEGRALLSTYGFGLPGD